MEKFRNISKFNDKYNVKEEESKWQHYWKELSIYNWDEYESSDNNYSIDTPPPTVSGSLHIGHAYSYTQADFIARFQRMTGKNVFYPIGFDDNGLPTERLVEKKRNIRAFSTERSEFVKICKEVIKDEEKSFEELFNSLALSCDWNQKYQSISDDSIKISQMSFLDLVEKQQVYRSQDPILWDVVDQTALSQADIEDKEKESEMHDIVFETTSGEKLKIATTRPELLPACVAVFYNPNDDRYKKFKDEEIITPLFSGKVKILADDAVDMEKGTGLVMCCTFGDTTDIMWWKKHNLPLREIISKSGKIREISFYDYSSNIKLAQNNFEKIMGLDVKVARKEIIKLLSNSGELIKSTPIKHTVKCAERSGAPLEIITTSQWFIKTIEHKEKMLNRSSELNWHPKSMKIRLDSWINAISWDWCISRQRYFGVPFPVWYSKKEGEEGKIIYAKKDQLPVDPLKDLPEGYNKDEVIPDYDVMDTWATSSVSPQLASRAVTKKFSNDYERHRKIFPFDLRPQAHEIIRTWAFYTILKSDMHENTLPWSNIMISGWCLAEDKSKMSKSKGNIVAISDIIKEYGSDSLRYWSSSSRLGADTAISFDILKNAKRLINKLWNASKFSSQYFSAIDIFDEFEEFILENEKLTISKEFANENFILENISNENLEQITKIKKIRKFVESKNVNSETSIKRLLENRIISNSSDLWILWKLNEVITSCTSSFKKYEFSIAKDEIENFFWKDFCDNYLEITKARAYNSDDNDFEGQISAIFTMYHCLKNILKLFAPFLPHITESIYQKLFAKRDSIHSKGSWPKLDIRIKEDDTKTTDNLIRALDLVRKFKASKNLSIKSQIKVLILDRKISNMSKNSLIDLQNVTNSLYIDLNFDLNEVENLDDTYDIVTSDDNSAKIAIKI